MARADKRAYMDDLASQAENAARRGKQGKVYKYRGTNDAPINDKQGRLLRRNRKLAGRSTLNRSSTDHRQQ